jgi:hypothetical protein
MDLKYQQPANKQSEITELPVQTQDTQNKKWSKKKKITISIIIIFVLLGSWAGLTKAGYIPNLLRLEILHPDNQLPYYNYEGNYRVLPKKPIIYLYPQQKQDVTVQLDYKGKLIADYPTYDEAIHGWNVTAYPDGHLINKADGKEYSYLFWEGESRKPVNYDLSTGFVVKGADTREFLQDTLSQMGLTPKEYNEFIVYWYPKMKDNPYNLIHFAGKEYTDTAPLTITPQPDSMFRVFMVYKKVEQSMNLKSQEIIPFNRSGFTVIEWGGSELN